MCYAEGGLAIGIGQKTDMYATVEIRISNSETRSTKPETTNTASLHHCITKKRQRVGLLCELSSYSPITTTISLAISKAVVMVDKSVVRLPSLPE
jgi:hypothetical protein